MYTTLKYLDISVSETGGRTGGRADGQMDGRMCIVLNPEGKSEISLTIQTSS